MKYQSYRVDNVLGIQFSRFFFLCGVCMLSPCLGGFSPGTQPKTCTTDKSCSLVDSDQDSGSRSGDQSQGDSKERTECSGHISLQEKLSTIRFKHPIIFSLLVQSAPGSRALLVSSL